MESRKLSRREAAFVRKERVIRLATTGPEGPYVVPVCHVLDGGAIYFGSDGRGRKVRNIRRTRRAALVADRYTERWSRLQGVSIVGRAEVFASGPVFARGVRLLYRKYPQYRREAPLEPGESVVVRVTPTRVMSWGPGQ